MRKYRTAAIGAFFLLGSLIFFIYSNSPTHLRALQDEKNSYRNHFDKNLIYTPYWYMSLTGCTFYELRPDQLNSWAEEYENRAKNKPCTLLGYYLYGPGVWMGIIAIFLFLLNFFDLRVRKYAMNEGDRVVVQGDEKQNKYIKMYGFATLVIIILEGAMISSFVVALMAWGESSSQNMLAENIATAAIIFCSITYFAFLWYGWGLHRANFKKIVLLTVLFPLPFIPFVLWLL